MLLEEALQKCLFLYLSVHPLASQLAGSVLGVEYSLSTCGLENPAVPFLSAAGAPICHISKSRMLILAQGPWAVHGGPVGHCGSWVFEWGCQERCQTSLPLQRMLIAPVCSPGLAPSILLAVGPALSLWQCSWFFPPIPSWVAPVLARPWAGAVWLFGSTGNHPAMLCSQCQALCGVIRTIITGPIPCHVLPAQCVCHISSPGAWRAEGTAGNHNGMQTGASKKSVAATFPPL